MPDLPGDGDFDNPETADPDFVEDDKWTRGQVAARRPSAMTNLPTRTCRPSGCCSGSTTRPACGCSTPIALEERCTCSAERIEAMLRDNFTAEEREDMAVDGEIEVVCEFCSADYHFKPHEFERDQLTETTWRRDAPGAAPSGGGSFLWSSSSRSWSSSPSGPRARSPGREAGGCSRRFLVWIIVSMIVLWRVNPEIFAARSKAVVHGDQGVGIRDRPDHHPLLRGDHAGRRGLDYRFGWSGRADWVVILGHVLMAVWFADRPGRRRSTATSSQASASSRIAGTP